VVPLPPKALAVLWALVSQAGQVVTKAALREAVWADTAVSDAVLTTCIRLLRRALAEDATQPRYIATVHRLGYRFLAPVTAGASATPPEPPDVLPAPSPLLVGREAELAQLHTWFTRAQHGARQMVFVTGEPGIGKTSVVEAFLHQLGPVEALWLGWGECVEHYGVGEAYLPVLKALGRLGRTPGGEQLVACLQRHALTWLVQMPALLSGAELDALQRTVQGTPRARMLRELAEALEALATARPVVLVLEDLHWSDLSTVEALALLARRRERARLLVLGTYWPTELLVRNHPLKTVKQELAARGQCVELPLGYLRREAVSAYIAQRRAASEEACTDLAALVYRWTEGHPLFMVQVVDYVEQQASAGTPLPIDEQAAVEVGMPPGLRELIEAQLGRLTEAECQILEVASVVGAVFAVASVAAGMQTAPDAVEAVCESLARRGQFIDDQGLVTWPDGTVSGQYRFRHALYQAVLYQRLGRGQRARLHRAIGTREELGYGERASAIAVELAMHFERGQDAVRAARYLQQVGEMALQRQAHQEAIRAFTKGLTLLQTVPETAARDQQEYALQLALGEVLEATQGSGSPAAEAAFSRALVLSTDDSVARARQTLRARRAAP
jgi:predicted ATPase